MGVYLHFINCHLHMGFRSYFNEQLLNQMCSFFLSFFLQFISNGEETELSFSKNGRFLGVAFRLAVSTLAGRALYPHILCKNCSVSLNLDSQGVTWYPGPLGYCPLAMLPSAHRTRAPRPPSHRKDCEVRFL